MTTDTKLEPSNVNVRIKLSALLAAIAYYAWTWPREAPPTAPPPFRQP
jgi:hypothetical protein